MIDKTAIRAGRKFQSDLAKWLRGHGFRAVNLRLTGRDDEGDVAVVFEDAVIVIEAKRTRGIDLAGWWRQAVTEAANYRRHHPEDAEKQIVPMVVVARRNHSIAQSYVITPLCQVFDRD